VSPALQQLCERLLTTTDDLATQSQRLHEQAKHCRRLAAQAAQTTRAVGGRHVAQSLEQAGRRCEAAAQQLEVARSAAHRFVHQHMVDGSAAGSDSGAATPAHGDDATTINGGVDPSGIVSAATSTPAGLAFFAPNDRAMAVAADLKPVEGYRTYDLHGTSSTVTAWDGAAERDLSPSEFAAIVRADPGWDGSPIRLFSCDTGKGANPFAQQLADELEVEVLAPTQLAWSDSFGQFWAASATIGVHGETRSTWPPDGEFSSFRPKSR
jgi:hypothetical protein